MLRRATAAVLLCSTTACYTVQRVRAPQQFIPQRAPERVWVLDNGNGETFQLERPVLRADSVVGTLAGTAESLALQLTSDRVVFARQKSNGKTAQLIAGLGLLGGLAIYGVIAAGSGERQCATPGMRGCPSQ
jgi:hypothetical protein